MALSQCLRGGVSLDTYSMGREFKNAGVVSGGDLTTAACSTKLAYLFGRLSDPVRVGHLLAQNIRGEITSAESFGRKFFNNFHNDEPLLGSRPISGQFEK